MTEAEKKRALELVGELRGSLLNWSDALAAGESLLAIKYAGAATEADAELRKLIEES